MKKSNSKQLMLRGTKDYEKKQPKTVYAKETKDYEKK